MPTINQMVRKRRVPKHPRKPDRVLQGNPMLEGVILDTFIGEPRKPNSGNRKCAHVRLTNGVTVTVYIPGEGHNLAEHNQVLVRGGNVPDLSGVKYKVVRGTLDCLGVDERRQSRSRYGTKKPAAEARHKSGRRR